MHTIKKGFFMQLYEKLIFIMNLTQTSNRMLAKELQVDPSLVSRLRTGTRGIPRNREYLKVMSIYFSKRCTAEYQRQALSEMLGIKLSLTMKGEHLSEILYYWLCDDTDEVDRFMRTFETIKTNSVNIKQNINPCSLNIGNSVYYGNAGKRAAAQAVYQHLLSLKTPYTIFMFTDESDDWIVEDYSFSSSLNDWALNLIQRGFKIHQITPPITSSNEALETLIRWIPLYMTGQVTAYFYPRIRDGVHRRSLFVVPGEVGIVSNSMSGRRASYSTFLTNDKRLTQAYETEFKDYLSMCYPMLNVYRLPDKLVQCFVQFLTTKGTRIQKLMSLSAETTPSELVAYCIEKTNSIDLKKLGNIYLQEIETIEKGDDKYELIDIVCLASAEQVRTGRIPITYSRGTSEVLYYTPETYVLHLQNILRIMETCENYHFVRLMTRNEKESNLMIKEDHRALLVHMEEPFTVFEISHPVIVALYREYLFRLADKVGYIGIHRVKIMSQIRELIRELQS